MDLRTSGKFYESGEERAMHTTVHLPYVKVKTFRQEVWHRRLSRPTGVDHQISVDDVPSWVVEWDVARKSFPNKVTWRFFGTFM